MAQYMPPPSELPPGSIVDGYVRDSGGMQQEDSVPQQIEEMRKYCQQHGLILRDIYKDVAKTGTTNAGRKAFHEMLDVMRDSEMQPAGLLVWNFARFARELDDANYFKATIRRKGVIIHSLTDRIPEGPYGRMVEYFIDIANQEESRQTSTDVRRKMQAMIEKGFSPGGTPPKGYKAERITVGTKRNGTPRIEPRWIPDPKLVELVQLAWKLRATGASYGKIQKATGGRLYRSVGSWNSFFANISYMGQMRCGVDDEDKEFIISNHHPTLVDQETWDAVQHLRSLHPKKIKGIEQNNPRRISTLSLLSGIAFCVHCGAAMDQQTYKRNGNFWKCYICGKKARQEWKSCEGRMVNARNADVVVLDMLLSRILTPEYLNQLLKQVQAQLHNTSDIENQIQILQNTLKDTECSIRNLLDAIETYGAETAIDRLRQREKEKRSLSVQLQQLESQREARDIRISPEILQRVFDHWREQVKNALVQEDVQALRAIIRRFISRVDLGYDQINIRYRYSLGRDTGNDRTIPLKNGISPMLEGQMLELELRKASKKSIQYICSISPAFARKKRPPKGPNLNLERDIEIYRLHTVERKPIRELAIQYGISEIRAWNICTAMRRREQQLLNVDEKPRSSDRTDITLVE